jgi:hypothetical protein
VKVSDGIQWPEARELAERLVEEGDGSVLLVLMYGSRLWKTNPDLHSALDFVVIVDDYRSFFSGLARRGSLHRPVGLMTGLASILPPNVMAYTPDDGRGGIAKCLVIRQDDFTHAIGEAPPDHFVLGRMVQSVGIVWAVGASEEGWIQEKLSGAHGRVLDWVAPYIEGPFDAAELGHRLLEVCYQGEIRPESRGRAGRVFEAQAEHFSAALQPSLDAAVAAGTLIREGDRYVLSETSSVRAKRRSRDYFRRSKARSTLRWFKHVATFANWLPYLARKVERHTGRTIELTTLERKLPFIFLWPRAVQILMTKPRREMDT